MDEVRALVTKLRRLLMSRGRSRDDIDDLVQEAFLRLQLYGRDHQVRHTESFLVRTVLNLSAEQGRRARVRQVVPGGLESVTLIDPSPTPDEVLASRQRLLRLQAAMQRLSPRSREVLLLHRLDGSSYVQIAETLGISVSMVEKHIARAMFQLRHRMAEDGE